VIILLQTDLLRTVRDKPPTGRRCNYCERQLSYRQTLSGLQEKILLQTDVAETVRDKEQTGADVVRNVRGNSPTGRRCKDSMIQLS
jgi:hypothetical protein